MLPGARQNRGRWPAIAGSPYHAAPEKLLIGLQARRWSTRGHALESLPSGVGNPDTADIDQLGASVDDLMSYRYQPGLSQKQKHPICETEVKHPRFGAALPVDQQLQRATCFPAETTSLRGRRHLCPL
jgi:hypothetical protein